MSHADQLWNDLVKRIAAVFTGLSDSTLRQVWSSQAERTTWYRSALLGALANALGLESACELLQVDYALCQVVDAVDGDVRVPRIFIESENISATAEDEVGKLCALHAPLRVLLTTCEWDDSPTAWSGRGQRAKLLARWRRIWQAHDELWHDDGIVGVVVAEWGADDVLRLYANRLDDREADEQLLLSRQIGPAVVPGAPN